MDILVEKKKKTPMKISEWCFVHIKKISLKLIRKEKGRVAKIIFGKRKQI